MLAKGLQSDAVWQKGTEKRAMEVICHFSRAVSQGKGTETRRAVLMGWVGWQSWQLGFCGHGNQIWEPLTVLS